LVPAAGYPGSDILYTSGLNGSTHEPGVPIGRIAATTPGEVIAYFEKVTRKGIT
jgi:cell shape-determining protein MreC